MAWSKDIRRNLTGGQRFEFGFYQFVDHFFGRQRMFKLFEKRRRKFYKNLHTSLKASGEGKVIPIDRRKDLSLKEFENYYVKLGIPVVLEGAAKDWDCVKKWSMEYFKNLHGTDEIVMVDVQKEGYPYESTTLANVIDNIRSGGGKYYRFYPLLDRHPEHLKDFDYKWLRDRRNPLTWFEAFQVFLGGKGSYTALHNANQSNLFVQVYGEKDWFLYSHYYTSIVDPDPVRNVYRNAPPKDGVGCFNPFEPDYSGPYVLYKYIDSYSVKLQPGDVLWNPPFYWHAVKNASDSIGVGYRWLAPLYSLKISKLYMMLDMLANNPPFWKAYSLYKKDINLIHLAEYNNLEKYLKEKAEHDLLAKGQGVKIA